MLPFNPKNANLYGRKIMDLVFSKDEMRSRSFEPKIGDKRSKKQALSPERTNLIKGIK
jgi:hypothetical protein